MYVRKNIKSILLFFFSFFFLSARSQEKRFRFSAEKMGSPLHITLYATDSLQAAGLAYESFALIDSLTRIFSDYDPESELNQLLRAPVGQWQRVSAPMWEVWNMSKRASIDSRGAFDISAGRITHLWRKARKLKTIPAAPLIADARKHSGYRWLEENANEQTVRITKSDMQLDAGGIAKGYIAGQVLKFLNARGIRSALVDAGGDLVCSDAPPGKKGWSIGINLPGSAEHLFKNTLEITQCAVATSGDVYQYLEYNGRVYSHIVNPATGYAVTYRRNVTIVASDGAVADWLATACSILPFRSCRKLVRKHKASVLIATLRKNESIRLRKAGSAFSAY